VPCASATADSKCEGERKQKVEVTGTWKFEVEFSGGSGRPEFTFKQTGDKVTGQYKGQFGEADISGKVTGNKIEFEFSVQDGKAIYTGTIDKDTMKGTLKFGDQVTGNWTAKREAAKK
jgi:hypothetical protein